METLMALIKIRKLIDGLTEQDLLDLDAMNINSARTNPYRVVCADEMKKLIRIIMFTRQELALQLKPNEEVDKLMLLHEPEMSALSEIIDRSLP